MRSPQESAPILRPALVRIIPAVFFAAIAGLLLAAQTAQAAEWGIAQLMQRPGAARRRARAVRRKEIHRHPRQAAGVVRRIALRAAGSAGKAHIEAQAGIGGARWRQARHRTRQSEALAAAAGLSGHRGLCREPARHAGRRPQGAGAGLPAGAARQPGTLDAGHVSFRRQTRDDDAAHRRDRDARSRALHRNPASRRRPLGDDRRAHRRGGRRCQTSPQ